MAQPLAASLDYHPTHRANPRRGGRRVDARLRAITAEVDFRGKTVLDLGCNGGYFSFGVAGAANRVLAIDGEAELIRRNRVKQTQLGIANIEFRQALITPEFVHGLPDFDIVLFLSVFHHMLCASAAHDWNTEQHRASAMQVMTRLRDKAETLVFEMGYPGEGFDWSAKLPPMDDPCDWIKSQIFGPGFDIEILPPPAYRGAGGTIRRLATPALRGTTPVAGILRRSLRVDPRDGRHIFIGRRN